MTTDPPAVRDDDGADGADPRRAAGRLLGAELRRMREMAGLSGRQLGEHIGRSHSQVSRIERGLIVPSLDEATAWTEAVGAGADAREQVRRLIRAAHTDVTHHRETLSVLGHLQAAVAADEATARLVRCYSNEVVPGLLQTADYARRVFALADPRGEMDHAAALAGRVRRQDALYDSTRRFEFLLTEAALRWRPGPPAVLIAQLDRISSLSELGNVSVGVIPWTVEAPAPPYGAYDLHAERTDDREPSAAIELLHGSAVVSHPDDLARYLEHWDAWAAVALWGDDARAYLDQLARPRHECE